MTQAEQRIYLVGAGQIARLHATVAGKLPVPVALSVADPDPGSRATFAESFPGARVHPDAATMLAEPARDDDIVVVATPPYAHAAMTALALESGRHVLCEKPLAKDFAEAESMVGLARAKGLLLADCAARFRDIATTRALRDVVPRLGPPHRMRYVHRQRRSRTAIDSDSPPWFLDRSRTGGGILMDWGPYDLTLLDDLLAPVSVEVRDAWLANPRTALNLPPGTVFDVETQVGATLVYELAGGERVHVDYEHAACTHGLERREAELDGLDGSAHWDWLAGIFGAGPPTIALGRDQAGAPATDQIEVTGVEKPYDITHKLLASFSRLVRGEVAAAPDVLLAEDALFVFGCLRAIYDCAATGTAQRVERAATTATTATAGGVR
ncbi:Predicted dehydrogenase [Actinopolymorpha cephalotaxi]|uniref:Dehydrogenase n=1 Tax=Actinopolymorpha cephalotaxi TaxID=504797 RepID=A0A1I2ZXK6_9ACTN|nr:Gfo/Idh/MocA family oxidoreductase [Actinopolymorpha cephalotaxi]NYH84220.1 putative dehydrogenase [Actinopolymorpha cephalotaxi]SFH42410.1 Predicted dehydrogenase [Actinopolymorpha cephalotaxi]